MESRIRNEIVTALKFGTRKISSLGEMVNLGKFTVGYLYHFSLESQERYDQVTKKPEI